MIVTQATAGQKNLVKSSDKAPPEYMAVVIVKNRKTGEALRYAIAKEWHPKIISWRTDLDPSGCYERVANRASSTVEREMRRRFHLTE